MRGARGVSKAVQTTEEELAFFLPVVVEIIPGGEEDEPKISKRCMQVLRQYVASKRTDLMATAEESEKGSCEDSLSDGDGSTMSHPRFSPSSFFN